MKKAALPYGSAAFLCGAKKASPPNAQARPHIDRVILWERALPAKFLLFSDLLRGIGAVYRQQ